MWLVKASANGDSLWSHTYGGDSQDEARAVIETSDGGFLIAGRTYSFGSFLTDMWVVKTDANGDSLWSRTFGAIDEDEAWDIVETSDGGYLIVSSSGYMSDLPATKLRLVRLNSAGDQVWDRWYGDGQHMIVPRAVYQNKDGGFLVAADIQNLSDGTLSLLLLRTDRSGEVSGCEWLEDAPLRPPEEKIPDTTFGGWSESIFREGAFTIERYDESWLEISNGTVQLNPLCVSP